MNEVHISFDLPPGAIGAKVYRTYQRPIRGRILWWASLVTSIRYREVIVRRRWSYAEAHELIGEVGTAAPQ